jgi:predicted dehydrogenase
MVFVLAISDTTEAEEQQRSRRRETYGVGVLGNCCTHGVALCSAFIKHPRTRVVAAFEKNPRRAEELAEVLGQPLEKSYDAVIGHTEVDFVVVTCDPCEKAALVEKAAGSGKHVFLNKPGCDNLDNARKIVAAVEQYPIYLVYDIPMVRFNHD